MGGGKNSEASTHIPLGGSSNMQMTHTGERITEEDTTWRTLDLERSPFVPSALSKDRLAEGGEEKRSRTLNIGIN